MRSLVSRICAFCAFSTLTACGSLVDNGSTVSNFVDPDVTGQINIGLTDWTSNFISDSDTDGYAYEVGIDWNNDFRAVSGIVQSSQLTTLPSSGTAAFTGGYSYLKIDRADPQSNYGTTEHHSGTLDMDIDLASGYVVAKSQERTLTTNQRLLRIVGYLNGQAFVGNVTVRPELGSDGTLTGDSIGVIGSEKAIGAFHASNDEDTIAGGFLLTPE